MDKIKTIFGEFWRIRKRKLVRGSLVLFAGSTLVNLCNYVFHLAVGRMVSPDAYGSIESLAGIIGIAGVPASTLFMLSAKFAAKSQAAGDRTLASRANRHLIKRIIYPVAFAISAAAVSTSLFSKSLGFDDVSALNLSWLVVFFSIFFNINSGTLTGWQDFSQANYASVFGSAVKLILGFILVKLTLSASGAIGAMLLGTLAAWFLSAVFLKKRVSFGRKIAPGELSGASGMNGKELREITRFLLPVLAGNLALGILANADVIAARSHLSPELSGAYGALFVSSRMIYFAAGSLATVLFSLASEEAYKNGDPARVMKEAAALLFMILAGAFFFYSVFPGFVLHLMFGAKYAAFSHNLFWFALASVLISLNNFLFNYLVSTHERVFTYVYLALGFLSILGYAFYGTGLAAIVGISIVSQAAAICLEIFFLKCKKKKTQSNFPLSFPLQRSEAMSSKLAER